MAWLNDVEIFVQVVETGSFTATAERLNLSKAVVSKYVSRLESELGVRLLFRTTRRLSLTEAGEIFFERSRLGLQELNGARSEVDWMQGAPRGTLKIAVPVSFGVAQLAQIMSKFTKQYPAVDFDIVMDDKKTDIVKEGFDLAIRITDDASEKSIVTTRIAPCRHVICATTAYIERCGLPEKPSDLINHTILTYSYQQSALRWIFTAPDGAEEVVEMESKARINNSLAIREMLLCGAGLTRIPTFIVGEDIAAGRLVALLSDYDTLEISIFLVYPDRKFLSPKVSAFIEFLSEEITDSPQWDAFRW
jgi:DNA-binding transcriptional LysR family regulator